MTVCLSAFTIIHFSSEIASDVGPLEGTWLSNHKTKTWDSGDSYSRNYLSCLFVSCVPIDMCAFTFSFSSFFPHIQGYHFIMCVTLLLLSLSLSPSFSISPPLSPSFSISPPLSLSWPDFLHHCVINLWQFAYSILCLHSHKALFWVMSESETVSPHTHTHTHTHTHIYLQTPPPLQNVDCLGLATMLTGPAPLSTSNPIPKIVPF